MTWWALGCSVSVMIATTPTRPALHSYSNQIVYIMYVCVYSSVMGTLNWTQLGPSWLCPNDRGILFGRLVDSIQLGLGAKIVYGTYAGILVSCVWIFCLLCLQTETGFLWSWLFAINDVGQGCLLMQDIAWCYTYRSVSGSRWYLYLPSPAPTNTGACHLW